MSEKSKEVDVLEDIKKLDKAIKAKVLIEQIGELKKVAKKINLLRYETKRTLEELDISEKDQKRVIDYINELPDVKLSEDDKLDVEDKVHKRIVGRKQNVEEDIRGTQLPDLIKHFYDVNNTWGGAGYISNGNSAGGVQQVFYSDTLGDSGTYSVPRVTDMTYQYVGSSGGSGVYTLNVSCASGEMRLKL